MSLWGVLYEVAIHTLRKLILPHKEKIKMKLQRKKPEPAYRHYTVSYSVKKHRLLNQTGDVTKTEIGLDDEDGEAHIKTN